MTILEWVLAAMTSLAPDRDHTDISEAIATVVETEAPLFAGESGRTKTAALLVAVAFRESTFRNDAVSKTNDHCFLQINHRPDLRDNPLECARVGLAMLRTSMRVCPSHPIAFYAAGPRGCTDIRAQRISRDRMALALRLYAAVTP